MKLDISTPYVWSLYIVGTGITLILNFLALESMFAQLDWHWMMATSILISLYALLTARQLYTHGRTWPQKALLVFFPLSFVHLLFNGSISINLGLCAVNLFFWWVAYRLSGRLAEVSPYGGPSGYL